VDVTKKISSAQQTSIPEAAQTTPTGWPITWKTWIRFVTLGPLRHV